jgi:hypothetical protein
MLGVFIEAKKGGPVRRRRDKERRDQVEEQDVEGNSPKWMPVVEQGCGGERALGWSEEGET